MNLITKYQCGTCDSVFTSEYKALQCEIADADWNAEWQYSTGTPVVIFDRYMTVVSSVYDVDGVVTVLTAWSNDRFRKQPHIRKATYKEIEQTRAEYILQEMERHQLAMTRLHADYWNYITMRTGVGDK